MAVSNNGPQGDHRGEIGNVVYYMLNGQQVSREIGKTDKAPTIGQLNNRLSTKICGEFLVTVKEFINLGFGIEALGTTSNAFNMAMKYNRKNIIKGSYPDLSIDFGRVILSRGSLKQAENWQVMETDAGLSYTWNTNPEMAWPEATDQVMMLAYFPMQKKVIYTLFGSSRLSGGDLLEIPVSLRGAHAETYMSFVSADRKEFADSIYTGSFNQ